MLSLLPGVHMEFNDRCDRAIRRYPPSVQSLKDFVAEGERRYWLHVPIDRFNGQVIDKQIEMVNE
jgi:hypothetical protein